MAKFYTDVTELNQTVIINTETHEEANFLDVMRVVSYGLQRILESYDEYIYQAKTETLPQIYYCRIGTRVDYLCLAVDLIKEYMIENVAEFQFVNRILYSDMSIGSTLDPNKTPIAIQVAPSNHFQDGKARWMSLVNMSLTDPANGTTAVGNDIQTNPGAGITWGYEDTLGEVSNQLPSLDCISDGGEVTIKTKLGNFTSNSGCGPSDFDWSQVNLNDLDSLPIKYPLDERYWYSFMDTLPYPESGGNGALPSPYQKNGKLNSWSRLYALSQENGYILTDLMMNAQIVEWREVNSIDNRPYDGNYPAACVCRRFAPFSGNGYLPSICELYYIGVNITAINNLLSSFSGSVGVGDWLTYDDSGLGNWLWSSSEYGSNASWTLNTGSCYVSQDNRDISGNDSRVRAFLAY